MGTHKIAVSPRLLVFFFNDTATTEIYTLSLHDALPISTRATVSCARTTFCSSPLARFTRSEEHTSELQSLRHLVCRLLLEKKRHHDHELRTRCARAHEQARRIVQDRQVTEERGGGASAVFFLSEGGPPQIYSLPLHAALPI